MKKKSTTASSKSSGSTMAKSSAATVAAATATIKSNEPSEQELVRLQTTDPHLWRVEDVAKWLDYILLSEYKTLFIENSITGDELLDLNAHELQNMGVKKVGHRKKLIRKIHSLQTQNSSAFNGANTTGSGAVINGEDDDDDDGNDSDTSTSSDRSWTSGRSTDSFGSAKHRGKRNTKISVKCKYKGEFTVIKVKKDTSLKKLKKKLRQEYHQRMKVSYKDDDGDLITIKREKQWEELRNEAAGSGKAIRLNVQPFKSHEAREIGRNALNSKEMQMLGNLVDPVVVINKDGLILYFNNAAEQLFSYTQKEVMGSNVKILMPDNTAESHDFYLWRYQKDRVPRIIGKGRRVIAQKKDGTTFPTHLSITEGANSSYTGVFSDFHASKAIALDGSSSSASSSPDVPDFSLLENLLQSVVVINAQGIVQFFNKQAEKLTGFTAMEVMGRNVSMLMPDPYRSEHDSYLTSYLKTGKAKVMGLGRDVVVKHKTGRVIPVHLSVTEQERELSKGVKTQWFTGILTPIQDKLESSKAVLDQQREVLELLMVAAIVIDQNGIIQIFNKSATTLLGWTAVEMVGKNVSILVPSPDKEKHDQYIKRYLKTGRSKVLGIGRDLVAQHKDGKMIPIHLSVTERRDEDGTAYFSGVMQKI